MLDPEHGTVRFGNGTNGRRPAIGAEVIVAIYRHGGGSSADVGSDAPPIKTSRHDVVDTTDSAPWTVLRTEGLWIPIQAPLHDHHSRHVRFYLRLALAFAAGVITATTASRVRRD